MAYVLILCFTMMVLGVVVEVFEYLQGGLMNIGNDTLAWTGFWSIMTIVVAGFC